jgi:hypothetical protein
VNRREAGVVGLKSVHLFDDIAVLCAKSQGLGDT